MLVLALVVRVLPVYITKPQLDTYAVELVREAEIAGRVGYDSASKFAAACKAVKGKTPLEYRREGQ